MVVSEDRSSRDRTQFGTHQQAGGGLARGTCRDLVRRVGEGFPALSIRGLVSFRVDSYHIGFISSMQNSKQQVLWAGGGRRD